MAVLGLLNSGVFGSWDSNLGLGFEGFEVWGRGAASLQSFASGSFGVEALSRSIFRVLRFRVLGFWV